MADLVNSSDMDHEEIYILIFELLCSRRVDDAIELAQISDMHRLAMLLCQIGGDDYVRDLLMDQLNLWMGQRADSQIPPELMVIYRLLGMPQMDSLRFMLGNLYYVGGELGESSEGSGDFKCVLSGLEWSNALGVAFWYCSGCTGKLSDAVCLYDALNERNLPVPPFAPNRDGVLAIGDGEDYTSGDDDSLQSLTETHTLYSLVKAFYPSVDDASDTVQSYSRASLRPRGYTRDFLDYRGSFVSLLLLECTGMLSNENSSSQIAIVRQHMISQLLSEGMWQWAVFVCLQIEDPLVRSYAVRDIVLRYGGKLSWESDEESSEYFLMSRFLLSDSLLHEATAYRCSYERNITSQASYLIKCDQFLNASTIICRQLVPRALFNSPDTRQQIQALLTALENNIDENLLSKKTLAAWECGGGSLLSYFQLKDEVDMLRRGRAARGTEEVDLDQMSIEEVVEISGRLVKVANELLGTLTTSNFGMCNTLSDADTVTKIAVHDIGSYLFKVITDISKTDYNLAHEYLTHSELAEAPVLDSCRLQVSRRFAATLGGEEMNN